MTISKPSKFSPPWFSDPALGPIPESFTFVNHHLFFPAGYIVENVERETESAEYGAIRFQINHQTLLYRQAKTTPKKVGQFVTLWKREALGSDIMPIDIKDGIDWVIIAANDDSKFGIFVFSAQLLAKKHVFSDGPKDGKRAIRVYAPWTQPVAAQAKSTKKWQAEHFIHFDDYENAALMFSKMINEL